MTGELITNEPGPVVAGTFTSLRSFVYFVHPGPQP